MTLALPARRRPRAAPLARAARALWVALTDAEREQILADRGHPDPWHAALARLDAAFGARGAWLAATPTEIAARLGAVRTAGDGDRSRAVAQAAPDANAGPAHGSSAGRARCGARTTPFSH